MPIVTNPNDVVFVGHGTYQGGAQNFQLPAGVELHILQAVGSAMTDGPVTALVGQLPIDRLILRQSNGAWNDFPALGLPQIYQGGQPAPDLVLHDLGPERAVIENAMPHGPHHVITVTVDTRLQQLLNRDDVQKLIANNLHLGRSLRVFWAACTHLQQNPKDPPCVYGNALAVALAAVEYAQKTKSAAAIAAADAALQSAQQHPQNTAAAIAAARLHDNASADLTHAV